MPAESFIAITVISTLIGVAVLYLVIRYATQHGTTAALERHELWMRDGSLDRAIEKRQSDAAALAKREEEYGAKWRAPSDVKLDRPSTPKDLPSGP